MNPVFAAVDLGATSGRVIAGEVIGTGADARVELTEVGRFSNDPVLVPPTRGAGPATLTWDTPALWRGILTGLREAVAKFGTLAGIAIDSWAVDYGLVDESGRLLALPVCYRDARTAAVIPAIFERVSAQQQYARNGLQFQPFTTAFQLLADPLVQQGTHARALLLPDLIGAWLTGVERAEVTNASTTGLFDAAKRTWSQELLDAFGLSADLLPELIQPGTLLGQLRPAIAEQIGASGAIPVWATGSHDTASAVVAVPLSTPNAAYISCGTWSLVGLELPEPVLSEDARAANVTNEAGVDGTVRYLKNVMGLWVLSETLRWWQAQGQEISLQDALAEARSVPFLNAVVDIDSPELLPPGDMPGRIAELARAIGQPVPETVGEVVRCILDSLALAYRRSIRQIGELAGRPVDAVHVVGGGILNAELMQLTADATGCAVIAGPAEGAALGNILVQARAAGVLAGALSDLRQIVTNSTQLAHYAPGVHTDPENWSIAERAAYGTSTQQETP